MATKVIVRKKEYLPAKMLQGWSDGALQFLLQQICVVFVVVEDNDLCGLVAGNLCTDFGAD